MKITEAQINIVEGHLTIDGERIDGLFEEAYKEPHLRKLAETSAYLPSEDVTPGHVFPAVVLTTSRAS